MSRNLIPQLFAASRISQRTIASLLLEMTRLRLSGCRLGLSEYFAFRLYLNDIHFDEKRRFVGWSAQAAIEEILVDDFSRFLSLDKVTMYSLLASFQLPIPKLHAVYRSSRPNKLIQLDSIETLRRHFSQNGTTPTYMKPSYGGFGKGNTLLLGFDGSKVTLGDGRRIVLEDFFGKVDDRSGLGWIFQEPLTPHPEIARLCGEKISGIRIHSFLSREGPRLIKAIWKINVGETDTDNFQHGASGNMLAAVDIETGMITRVVSGVGLEQKVDPQHPLTGARLTGFNLPHWAKIKTLVCDAQLAFPGFLCPGWDIAICEDGPKILEVNSFGDLDLAQHSHRAGFLDDSFLDLLRERGLAHLVNSAPGRHQTSKKNHRLGKRKHHWPW